MQNEIIDKLKNLGFITEVADSQGIADAADITGGGGSTYDVIIPEGEEGPTPEQVEYIWNNAPDRIRFFINSEEGKDEQEVMIFYLFEKSYDNEQYGNYNYMCLLKDGMIIFKFRNRKGEGLSYDVDEIEFGGGGGGEWSLADYWQIDEMFPAWYDFPAVITHSVDWSLQNVYTMYNEHSIVDGNSLSVYLACSPDYVFNTVTVTMGGVDMTSAVWRPDASGKSGGIFIPSVTADVFFSADAIYSPGPGPGTTHNVELRFRDTGGNTHLYNNKGDEIYDGSTIADGGLISGHIDGDSKNDYNDVATVIKEGSQDKTQEAWEPNKKDVYLNSIHDDVYINAVGFRNNDTGATYLITKTAESGTWFNDTKDKYGNMVGDGDYRSDGNYIYGTVGYDTKSGYTGVDVTITINGSDVTSIYYDENKYLFNVPVTGNVVITLIGLTK